MATSPRYSDPEVLARISSLGFRAHRVVEGTVSGQHRSPFHGFSVEFADYREYAPGDDLKRLDWRALARSDRYYIKLYEEESNLRATLVLDASASMRYGRVAMTKFDYAATLAASMATLLIRQQDPVGLALCDSEARQVLRPAATQAQLVHIIERLEAAKPDRQTELGGVISQLADQIKARGVVIIISDLLTNLDTLDEGLGRLLYRGHEILIFQILDPDEIELPFREQVLFHDIEGVEELFAEPWAFRKAYQEAMEEFIRDVRSRCSPRGIDHLMLRTDQDLGLALSHYLHNRERLRGSRSARNRAAGGRPS